MSATMGNGPVGWIIDRKQDGDQTEAEEIAGAWIADNGAALDLLHQTLRAAAERGDGDSLGLWLTTLRGLAQEIEKILTAAPVAVVVDAAKH
jgi:hypothetical protein